MNVFTCKLFSFTNNPFKFSLKSLLENKAYAGNHDVKGRENE